MGRTTGLVIMAVSWSAGRRDEAVEAEEAATKTDKLLGENPKYLHTKARGRPVRVRPSYARIYSYPYIPSGEGAGSGLEIQKH